MERVLVMMVGLLRPAVSRSEIGSTSSSVTMSRPKAAHKSPMRPALAATLASLCSLSLATTVMNWTMYATWGCTIARSGEGAVPSPFKPATYSKVKIVESYNHLYNVMNVPPPWMMPV